MRKVKDNTEEKLEALLERSKKKEGIKLVIGSKELTIPEHIAKRNRKISTLWDACDVKDLLDNYDMITTVSKMPLFNVLWLTKELIPLAYKDKTVMEWYKKNEEEIKELGQIITKGKDKFSSNYNYVTLENVYLGNFEFIRRKTWEVCNMEIRDKTNNSIKGVFLYRHDVIKQSGDENRMSELGKVLSYKEFSTPFDIFFSAMPQEYKMASDGPILKRDKSLIINSISKFGKDVSNPSSIHVDGLVPVGVY